MEAGSGPPPADAGPAATGAPVNQGATGAGPDAETRYRGGPMGAQMGGDDDAFAQRPELFVGAAFAGGFAVAMLLRRLGS